MAPNREGGLYDRMKPVIEGYRAETGVPRMYENFEWLAEQGRTWQPMRA